MIKTLAKTLAVLVLLTGVTFASEEAAEEASQVCASHILVKTAAEAMQIKKDLDNGGDFEYYAQLYSLCPSGRNGGNLGCFGRGQMVPSFEKKAFSMNVGEVSDPVMTQFGWHLIKINDKK